MNTLTQQLVRELLDYNPFTDLLYWKPRGEHLFPTTKSCKQWNGAWAGKEAFTATDKKGYKVGAIFNKACKAHRIIWLWVYGCWPDQIDHDDGVKSHNWIFNLCDVSNLQNHRNMGRQKNNVSGAVGVSWAAREERWKAAITLEQKQICLGYFKNYWDAVLARKFAEVDYNFHPNHGDKVRNNVA